MVVGMFNVILWKLGPFEFNFATIISFLVGLLFGFILTLLIYALAVVSSLKTKNFFAKTQKDDLTTTEVKDMVLQTQTAYKDKELRGDMGRMSYCYSLGKDLAYGIAVRFYPESKHPFLELSINELTLLTGYITNRVNELLDHKGIRMLRKLKISTIANISTKKKDIEESKAFQTSMVIGKSLSKAKYVLNVLNPINWGRKLIVDKVMNIIIDQICLVILSIVGEETYKIYSKKVFNKDIEIDTGSDEFIEEMSNSIKDAAIEMNTAIPVADASKQFKRKILVGHQLEENYCSYDETCSLKQKYELKGASE